jgi:hypothetical protein
MSDSPSFEKKDKGFENLKFNQIVTLMGFRITFKFNLKKKLIFK